MTAYMADRSGKPVPRSLWRCPHVHHFRIGRIEELDAEFLRWVQEAYAVGRQDHLRRPGRTVRRQAISRGQTRPRFGK